VRTQNTKKYVCTRWRQKDIHGVATIIMLCNVEVSEKNIEEGIEH
jgi:hypothetical protein